MSSFEYEQLTEPAGQIRLLELLPGSGKLQCEMKVVELDKAKGTYEPLSYYWGNQKARFPILLNNASTSVGSNLHLALKRLRRQSVKRTLWVDALCINQGDPDEKSIQVQLMRHIYENGIQTIVWLGEQDHRTALAFQIIGFLAQYAESNPEEYVLPMLWREYYRKSKGKARLPLRGLGLLWSGWDRVRANHALDSILDRAWFTRVWIIQEVAVSTVVLIQCGSQTVPWDIIERASSVIRDPRYDVRHVSLKYLIIERTRYQSSGPENLPSKVWSVARSNATDPRDKIYAVLGLLKSSDPHVPIVIDYNAAMTDVFKEVTRESLKATKDAGMLAFSIGCRDQEDLGPLPSWVWRPMTTDWDLAGKETFAWAPGDATAGTFSASGSSICSPVFVDEAEGTEDTEVISGKVVDGASGCLLGLSGYEIDTVTMVGPVMERRVHSTFEDLPEFSVLGLTIKMAYAYVHWRHVAGLTSQRTYRGTLEPIEDAFRKVIRPPDILQSEEFLHVIRALPSSGSSLEDKHRDLFRWFDALVVKHFNSLRRQRSLTRLDRLAACLPLQHLAWKFSFGARDAAVLNVYLSVLQGLNRCMIRTATGYIGLAPRETRVGDRVVLLSGSKAPFILRKMNSRWRVVGDSHIHGVMGGEAWDATKCERLWIE